MHWLYNLNDLQYELFLRVLFTHCETVRCIVSEEQCAYFDEISYECMEKHQLKMQHIPQSSDKTAPFFQYTFYCSEKTEHFFKQKKFYRLHWQMINIESLTFWKDGHCVFRAISNNYVELEMEPALERQIVHLF